MKKQSRVLAISFCLAVTSMGVAYASWESDFTVLSEIKTYAFDVLVNGEGLNGRKAVKSTFTLSEDIVLDMENTGTVAARLKKLKVKFKRDRKSLTNIVKDITFDGVARYDGDVSDAGISFTGRALNRTQVFRALRFRFDEGDHLIEPKPYSKSNYEIELEKDTTLADLLQPLERDLEQFKDKRDKTWADLDEVEDKIEQLEQAYDDLCDAYQALLDQLEQLCMEDDAFDQDEDEGKHKRGKANKASAAGAPPMKSDKESDETDDDDDDDKDDDDDDDKDDDGDDDKDDQWDALYEELCKLDEQIEGVERDWYAARCKQARLQMEVTCLSQSILCTEEKIEARTYAYENDQVIVTTFFELYNR